MVCYQSIPVKKHSQNKLPVQLQAQSLIQVKLVFLKLPRTSFLKNHRKQYFPYKTNIKSHNKFIMVTWQEIFSDFVIVGSKQEP